MQTSHMEVGEGRPVAALSRCTRPLRPEAKLPHGLPALQHAWPATDCPQMFADVHR
jgi:hypothetical protein